MDKLRVIFDNNVLDKFPSCTEEEINCIIKNCIWCYGDVNLEELNQIKNVKTELYENIIKILKQLEHENIEPLKFIDWNTSAVQLDEYLESLRNKNNSNIWITYNDIDKYQNTHKNGEFNNHENDKIIALTYAVNNIDIIVTNDNRFYKSIKKQNINVKKFNEFIEYI